MSSTYVHYCTPSSLPSDFALISRYANTNTSYQSDIAPSPDRDLHYTDNITTNNPDLRRRPRSLSRTMSSQPGQYMHFHDMPLPRPSIDMKTSFPTENTPLLAPSDPIVNGENHDIQEESNLWRTYYEEFKIIGKYTLPVFGTHVLEYSLILSSVVAIGHVSTTALAASTLATMTASVTGYSIIIGFASTLDTLLPSAWTSSQPNLVGLWSQRMAVVMTSILIPIIVLWFNAEVVLLGLRQDPDVAHLACIYLRWMTLGLPAYTFNAISRRYFQSQGLFAVPTRVILIVAPFNAFLNYFLVWGPAPFRLGFIGAPIASSISFNLISCISLLYGIFFVSRTSWHSLSTRAFSNLGVLIRLGLAGVGQTASEWWSWELIGLAASLLGPVSLAAQSVLLVSASTSYQAPFALSVAASVRIGNLLGEQNAARAGIACHTSLFIALLISVINSTIFFSFRNSWGLLFSDDIDVITLVASILPLVALFQVFDGLCACSGGILRARGKQFTGALLNLSAYYIIGIPLGIWLTFRRNMDLSGLWLGLTVALIYCATLSVIICLKTDWKIEVQKVQTRLLADKKAGVTIDVESPVQ